MDGTEDIHDNSAYTVEHIMFVVLEEDLAKPMFTIGAISLNSKDQAQAQVDIKRVWAAARQHSSFTGQTEAKVRFKLKEKRLGTLLGVGTGRNKRKAEQEASKEALGRLKETAENSMLHVC